jgi:uncharacterized membrane protein YsdA (DUF1294 family)
MLVTFNPITDERGRLRATDATLVDAVSGESRAEGQKKVRQDNLILPMIIVLIAFFCLVAYAVHTLKIPTWILGLYISLSLLTFIVYARDKFAAKHGAWRTRENTLHLLSLLGGWPGAMIAQRSLHHKSRKTSFKVVFWITVALNCASLGFLLTPEGENAYRAYAPAFLQNMSFDGLPYGNYLIDRIQQIITTWLLNV